MTSEIKKRTVMQFTDAVLYRYKQIKDGNLAVIVGLCLNEEDYIQKARSPRADC